MTQPIIVPIHHTRTIECIVVEGKRYCENQPTTREVAIAGIIFFLLVSAWILAIMYFLLEKDNWKVAVGMFLAPFIIALIILI